MASVRIELKTKVEVDNCGVITFIAEDGEISIVQVHPCDLGNLVRFLVRHGYDFRKGGE